MNTKRLYEILRECTCQLRKGAPVECRDEPGVEVSEIYMMPHESEVSPLLEKVDLEFVVIGVDRTEAEKYRRELIQILNSYPHPDRLAGGPSYIEVGAEIGDQGAAFQLFALGKVLGLWNVVTPALLGATGREARDLAASGFIMITGYRPSTSAETSAEIADIGRQKVSGDG